MELRSVDVFQLKLPSVRCPADSGCAVRSIEPNGEAKRQYLYSQRADGAGSGGVRGCEFDRPSVALRVWMVEPRG